MRRQIENLWRAITRPATGEMANCPVETAEEPPLGMEEDPFGEPVVLEIRDVFDLHTIPPALVKAVVEEYLREARRLGFPGVRLIHGKGIGVQRAIVRSVLDRTEFVIAYRDAPPSAGGCGATLVEFRGEGE
jgi:hypothetical protein